MTDYDAMARLEAAAHQLNPELVLAVIRQESSGRTDAFRYEPNVKHWFAVVPPLNERRACSSYGLMQVLYATATDFGFAAEPEELFKPTVGLIYGCAILADCLAWAGGDEHKALCAYNAGKKGWQAGKSYADRVLARMRNGM